MGVIFFVLGILLLTGAVAAIFFGIGGDQGFKPWLTVFGAILLVLAMASCTSGAGVKVIDAQEVAVVHRTAGTDQANALRVIGPGVNVITPVIDKTYRYDLSLQTVTMAGETEPYGEDYQVRAISHDGQQVFFDVTAVYRLRGDQIISLHKQWQSRYEESFIIPTLRTVTRDVASNFTAQEIYEGGRDEVENHVFETMEARLARSGLFELSDVLIRDIRFTAEFMDAVENKQIAEQEAAQAQNRIEQSRAQAEQARVEAQGTADAAVIAAQGRAESRLIEAEAEAKALEMVASVIEDSPDLVNYTYITELGDNVRIIVVPSNTPYLFDFNNLTTGQVPD